MHFFAGSSWMSHASQNDTSWSPPNKKVRISSYLKPFHKEKMQAHLEHLTWPVYHHEIHESASNQPPAPNSLRMSILRSGGGLSQPAGGGTWNGGTPSHHPNFNGIFRSKPFIWGYPHLWKPLYLVNTFVTALHHLLLQMVSWFHPRILTSGAVNMAMWSFAMSWRMKFFAVRPSVETCRVPCPVSQSIRQPNLRCQRTLPWWELGWPVDNSFHRKEGNGYWKMVDFSHEIPLNNHHISIMNPYLEVS